MICPQCQKPVADASVSCAVCGSPTGSQNVQSGTIHAAASGVARSQAGAELPEWRRELARRLQRIKEKREAAIPIEESLSNIPSLPLKTAEALRAETASAPAQPVVRTRRSPRKSFRDNAVAPKAVEESRPEIVEAVSAHEIAAPAPAPLPEPEQQLLEPAVEAIAEESAPPVPEPAVEVPNPEPESIQSQVDNVIPAQTSSAVQVASIVEAPPPAMPVAHATDKLILLSRTLSGLVDLTVVFLCGFSCVMAAEIVSGFADVDAWSWVNFALLQTTIFFLYSVFFLGAANQTIGMMVTDLRVVDPDHQRPRISQIWIRSAAYLTSLLGFGIGLVWGFFDRESACLHDKISRTCVIRISWPEDQTNA